MGFLSRKSKQAAATVVEEHPIVEELQEMEEAVPEAPGSPDIPVAEPAGPVRRSADSMLATTPAAPGREAEEAAVDPPVSDDDRNLILSEEEAESRSG